MIKLARHPFVLAVGCGLQSNCLKAEAQIYTDKTLALATGW